MTDEVMTASATPDLASQYATTTNLDARIALHDRFTTSKQPWQQWVFDQLEIPDGADVLEIGCGTGRLWVENAARVRPTWRVTLTDFSPAMVDRVRSAAPAIPCEVAAVVAEATALPFPEKRFDVVVANHVLYHVEGREGAFAEITRVLRPNGRLYAAANSLHHLRELHELVRAVAPDAPAENTNASRFGAETGGPQLRRWFARVDLREHPDSLAVTDPAAVAAYIRSTERWRNVGEAELAAIERLVAKEIEIHGFFRISKHAVLFCAQDQIVPPRIGVDS